MALLLRLQQNKLSNCGWHDYLFLLPVTASRSAAEGCGNLELWGGGYKRRVRDGEREYTKQAEVEPPFPELMVRESEEDHGYCGEVLIR